MFKQRMSYTLALLIVSNVYFCPAIPYLQRPILLRKMSCAVEISEFTFSIKARHKFVVRLKLIQICIETTDVLVNHFLKDHTKIVFRLWLNTMIIGGHVYYVSLRTLGCLVSNYL